MQRKVLPIALWTLLSVSLPLWGIAASLNAEGTSDRVIVVSNDEENNDSADPDDIVAEFNRMKQQEVNQLWGKVREAIRNRDFDAVKSNVQKILELDPNSVEARKILDSMQPLKPIPDDSNKKPTPSTSPNSDIKPTPSTSPMKWTPGTKAGERRVVNVYGVDFAFCWCPTGTVVYEVLVKDDPPRTVSHGPYKVVVSPALSSRLEQRQEPINGFWIMETEVTQEQWVAVMSSNPSSNKDGENLPVEKVTWYDCQNFCKMCIDQGLPVQLPNKKQWEYACRAGTTGPYAGNLNEMGWYGGNSGNKTHPVGTKKPNAWGLYDMHGNVSEWCEDWHKESYSSDLVPNANQMTNKVHKGGNFITSDFSCKSGSELWFYPNSSSREIGFRCVINPVK